MPLKKTKSTPSKLTPDEREAVEAAKSIGLPDAVVAIVAVRVRYPDTPEKDAQGIMECPICGTGEFHFSISSYNGHVWGRCTTEGCVKFVQ